MTKSYRLNRVIKELNISINRAMDFLSEKGIEVERNPNARISQEVYDVLVKQFNIDQQKREISKEVNINKLKHQEKEQHLEEGIKKSEVNPNSIKEDIFTNSSTDELPAEFLQENPFKSFQKEIFLQQDNFEDRKESIIYYENQSLKTIFSDFEAFSICFGLNDRKSRRVSRNYFKNRAISDDDLYYIHDMAMKAYKKYGGKTLSFFISFPPLPFKFINDAEQIFSELDDRKDTQDYPVIRIAYKNESGKVEKLKISYYSEKTKNKRVRYNNVLSIKNTTTGKDVMKISRNGYAISDTGIKQAIPILQLFVRFSQNSREMVFNYGLETGCCSICGRELTDSESIKLGMGPVCREKYG